MADKKQKKVRARTPMPHQDPEERARNFEEVALGYSREQAIVEAERCLQCKRPLCQQGCPVNIDIRWFIACLVDDDLEGAFNTIRRTNSLPAVCGRVCPQETQCEGRCILGKKHEPVAIGRLERYVADNYAAQSACEEVTDLSVCALEHVHVKVACIGSGPSSLTVAGYLAGRGIKVDVFEALHEPGGVLIYGIPEFRLPKKVVARELDGLRELGVTFHTNWVGGKTVTIQDLLSQGYNAIFIGVGAGLPRFLGVPGENLVGVFSANEYLTRVNLGRAYEFPNYDTPAYKARRVAVLGAGNVAMDAARTALRMGAEEVSIVYRRSEDEMPARREEIDHAIEEGIKIRCLCGPVSFHGDNQGRLKALTVQKMTLGDPDASGRCAPVCIEGETEQFPCDMAIIAVGTRPNPILLEATPDLALNKWGYIEADPETGETSIPNVFAGGDIVTGAATVISAMGAGRRAAKEIADRLL
ncbi:MULTISPECIES: NADPH-dependent glutamate synthase [unclassified Pseudodesulfovibrio]|uniref:NADPH-dependent glutamate synthase n=1 Tax=unclassified Pseudodesulfovibrio TaxID=2661612 RepID=UPI000FEB9C07|nr:MULTISPECIES: NADPH-dependent glutamate synthase [unclassified Pseudodesulfovibrio]MCJ2165413.1 NADPH-dependent glutamate synthase [Pseudodesulfovibrio sp. S3-i]RWU03167.1 NADPH-dependent glutamate synthase [Pseudodesulfovibrio sp. S3]